MRYIAKNASPTFFEDCKKQLPDSPEWQHFTENQSLSECKKALHKHLMAEQSGLCIYCERKIKKENFHIEHIDPKSVAKERAFDYQNLVVSCNGDLCDTNSRSSYQPEDVHSCGHKKDDAFDAGKFLNPVREEKLSEYLSYDKDTGGILPVADNTQARYTIALLHLDCIRLKNERLNAPQAIFDLLANSNNVGFRQLSKKMQIQMLLARQLSFPFISFLKAYFAPALSN